MHMQIIQTVIDQNSPYAAAYKYMHAFEQSEQLCASVENRSPREVRLHGPDQLMHMCRLYFIKNNQSQLRVELYNGSFT